MGKRRDRFLPTHLANHLNQMLTLAASTSTSSPRSSGPADEFPNLSFPRMFQHMCRGVCADEGTPLLREKTRRNEQRVETSGKKRIGSLDPRTIYSCSLAKPQPLSSRCLFYRQALITGNGRGRDRRSKAEVRLAGRGARPMTRGLEG
jgi:hypothetical protein